MPWDDPVDQVVVSSLAKKFVLWNNKEGHNHNHPQDHNPQMAQMGMAQKQTLYLPQKVWRHRLVVVSFLRVYYYDSCISLVYAPAAFRFGLIAGFGGAWV